MAKKKTFIKVSLALAIAGTTLSFVADIIRLKKYYQSLEEKV